MNVLIVDDEPLARNELTYLLEQCNEVKNIKEADSIEEALEKLLQYSIDLVFLDIHLTNESGLTLADKINRMEKAPIVIFATAYDEYAIEAFELEARDYILKPFELERVQKAIRRAHEAIRQKEEIPEKNMQEQATVFPIQMDDRIFMVKAKDILAVEVNQGETTIYTKEKEYQIFEPLNNWEKKLPKPPFMRIHRSYLVNLDKVKEIEPWFNQTYQVTLEKDLKFSVSRSYLSAFKERMGLTT